MMDKAMRTNTDQQSALSSQPAGGAERHVAAHGRGFTLTEVMIVIAIIAILAVVVAWAGSRVLSDAKVKQTHSLMNSLKSAMTECKAAAGSLVPPAHMSEVVPVPDYPGASVLRPTDASKQVRTDYYRQAISGTNWTDLTMPTADHPVPGSSKPLDGLWALPNGMIQKNPDDYRSEGRRLYGIQALYWWLMREPRSRQILSSLSPSSFARATTLVDYFPSEFAADYLIGPDVGAMTPQETQAILDAWGRPLFYGRDPRRNNGEAYLQSAGPDGQFDTEDDVKSYEE